MAEIRDLLTLRNSSSACCSDIRRLATEKKLQLEAKIRSMKTMSLALDELIVACTDSAGAVDDCPILGALDRLTTPSVKATA